MVVMTGAATMMSQKAEASAQKAYGSAGAVANEIIGGMRTVQAFNLQQMAVSACPPFAGRH